MHCGEHIEDHIKSIYHAINQLNPHRNNNEFFQQGIILSARTDDMSMHKSCEMQGDIHTFPSSDMMANKNDADQPDGNKYTSEYLSTFNASGILSAKLEVKVGAPLMLYCNLDFKAGICNRTCIIFKG
jgi:hypothetical protein